MVFFILPGCPLNATGRFMTHKRITDTRFYNELGSNIRLAREAAGKSQNDVAGHPT